MDDQAMQEAWEYEELAHECGFDRPYSVTAEMIRKMIQRSFERGSTRVATNLAVSLFETAEEAQRLLNEAEGVIDTMPKVLARHLEMLQACEAHISGRKSFPENGLPALRRLIQHLEHISTVLRLREKGAFEIDPISTSDRRTL